MVSYRYFICFLFLYSSFIYSSELDNNQYDIDFSEWIYQMNDFEKIHNALQSIIIDHPQDVVNNYKILSSFGILIDLQGACDVELAELYKDNNLDCAIFELFGKGLSMNCDCQDYFNKHLAYRFSEKKNDKVKDYFYNRFEDYYEVALQNEYINNLMNEYKEF